MPASLLQGLAEGALGASLAESRHALLLRLEREIGADSGHLTDPPTPRDVGPDRTASFGIERSIAARYLARRATYDRDNERLLAAMRVGPTLDASIYSMRERDRLPLYAELLRPQGTRSVLAGFGVHGGRVVVQLALKRHGSSPPFRRRDVEALAALLPTLAFADAGLQFLHARSDDVPECSPLTPRETEVAELVCKGLSNGDIARVLGTTLDTVKKQISSALGKLGAANRAELASMMARR